MMSNLSLYFSHSLEVQQDGISKNLQEIAAVGVKRPFDELVVG